MELNWLKSFSLAALAVVWLTGAGCASGPVSDKKVTRVYQPGEPGGVYLETYQTPLTIVAINAPAREATFQAEDGTTNVFSAGPEVAHFEKYAVGDRVKAVVARELVTHLDGSEPPAVPGLSTAINQTPGVSPGVWTANAATQSATVRSVNPAEHTATLRLSDGRTVTFIVRPDVDLTRAKTGARVSIRTASALGLMVENN